ncbi:hypothetical protein AB0395_45370 [Streptosporangium sp. NPDC051023]|uniref:hypothetical protein n=1 Tax=Streptosporangium sp. NPDC051023 TaxID=3155410 RepID=UPI00344B68B4
MTATATATPRTSLTALLASARPNRLVAKLAADAKADRLAKADRAARLAVALLSEGNTETAALLLQDATRLAAA